jgi:hypothetical protein
LFGGNTFTPVSPVAEKINNQKMFKTRKLISLLTIVAVAVLPIAVGCDKDDSPAAKTSYNLVVKDVLGVTGTVTFTETSSTSTTIDIVLMNAPSGTHPANLYMKSAVESGAVAVALTPVDATGKSSTLVSNMTYGQLIDYNGSVKVLKSSTEPEVILAIGDIGGNVITTTNKTYTLKSNGIFGVSGTALFEKRENGNTLVTISLTGTIAGQTYPSTINLGSVATVGGGTVVKTLSNVNGTIGKGYTNIQKLDSGMDITYTNWLVYDGYINVYQNTVNLNTIISQGNIGSN